MSCVVTGTPMPEVNWYHNHKNIDQSEDFVITYDRNTGKVELVIVDCLPDDQGRFRCIAKNPAGQAVSECTLTVRPATAVTPATQHPRDVTHTIRVEDVQKDTLEIEEQKTITDREVRHKGALRSGLISVEQKSGRLCDLFDNRKSSPELSGRKRGCEDISELNVIHLDMLIIVNT